MSNNNQLKLIKMKAEAIQLATNIVYDNKNFIEGNVAEYMIREFYANDENFYQYLTDEEMEEMNGNEQKWHKLGVEVVNMLKENFNYDISEFIY